MSYELAMETAGAKILAFGAFGSYQGDWWALVKYDDKDGWVTGSYGSCSGCDAFEDEFGYSSHKHGDKDWYLDETHKFVDGCGTCDEIKKRLVEFGKTYLDEIMTKKEALAVAGKNSSWDTTADEIIEFIKNN